MASVLTRDARATADAATGYTEAVMGGPPAGAGEQSAAARQAAAEMERSALTDLQADPGAAAQLDAELAAAESVPEVTGDRAAAARAQARADLESWFEAEAG